MSSKKWPFNRCGLSHCAPKYSTAPVVASSFPVWLPLASHASELSQCNGLPKSITIVVIFRVTPLYCDTVVSPFHRRLTYSSWTWQFNIIGENSRIWFSNIDWSLNCIIDMLSIQLGKLVMLFFETDNEYNVLAKSVTSGISVSKLPTSDK